MWLAQPLNDILSSRVKVAALRVLSESTAPLSGREIGRRARVGPGHISRVLRELVASGAVVCQDHGRLKTYAIPDRSSPLLKELRELFAAERRRYRELVRGLSEGVPGLLSVVMFGSEARGEARAGSDTDLLVVVEKKSRDAERRCRQCCLELAERHGLALSWHLVDPAELRQWDHAGHELWRSILSEGVRLSGASLQSLRRRWQPGEIT